MNILYKVTAKLEICYNDILCSNLAYILEERTAVILSFPIWRVYWQHIWTPDTVHIYIQEDSQQVVDWFFLSPNVFCLLMLLLKDCPQVVVDSLLSPSVFCFADCSFLSIIIWYPPINSLKMMKVDAVPLVIPKWLLPSQLLPTPLLSFLLIPLVHALQPCIHSKRVDMGTSNTMA